SRQTMPSPARRAAPAWGLPYPSASLRCTAARSGSSRSLGRVRRLPSRSRSSLNARWRRHEQAYSGRRGPAGYRQIIRDMLAPTDYEITEAEDGQQALEAIAKQRPDLILMDIQLPIIDGYTATQNQGRSCNATDPDHRGHLLCA